MSKAATIVTALVTCAVVALAPATALGATADLAIDKSDSADPVNVGSEFQYSIAITNAGPETASGVEVGDDLANELEFIAATPSQGSCDQQGKKVTCALGSLDNGATATIVLRVMPRKAGEIVNTATVSTADSDPQMANNTDTETTTVVEPAAPTCAGMDATVIGTAGSDTLTGTKKRDVIVAFGGNDTIYGLDGNDVICALGGDDLVKGQAGDDLVRGGGGNDSLGGGPGDDTLRGGTGADSCRGGPGHDIKRSC
jgi:uncharacterized repeat protein (TIGR01451 family)